MKCQKVCGPRWGLLIHQPLRGVTFAYNICLGHSIHSWKGLTEKNDFFTILNKCHSQSPGPQIPKKHRLGPQNSLRSLEPEKLPKNGQDGKLFFESME
jgi:hypothetical protein